MLVFNGHFRFVFLFDLHYTNLLMTMTKTHNNNNNIISRAALSKIRRASGTCHSVLTRRCAFRSRAKVAVDGVDRRSSAGKLFQVSGPEYITEYNMNSTEQFLAHSLMTVLNVSLKHAKTVGS